MQTQKPIDRAVNLLLAAVIGATGGITILIVGALLLLGLWLDQQLDTHPTFTFICILCSAPVALTVTVVLAVRLAKTIEKRKYGTPDSRDLDTE
jgi:hypothetical protein